ncbi:YybH family protein [Myxococcus vastator]|uniref:YybH family protein n=1 Tax=Myxococcus vastator TaxID=2709664 RepID=UPI0023DD7ECB|nr:nuclear transport factor 2 family protein [Myxococcus vastator]
MRAFTDAFNRDDLDAVMAYFTPDALYETYDGKQCRGLAQVREAFEAQFRGDFGRIRFLTEDMVVDAPAGKVALRSGRDGLSGSSRRRKPSVRRCCSPRSDTGRRRRHRRRSTRTCWCT